MAECQNRFFWILKGAAGVCARKATIERKHCKTIGVHTKMMPKSCVANRFSTKETLHRHGENEQTIPPICLKTGFRGTAGKSIGEKQAYDPRTA